MTELGDCSWPKCKKIGLYWLQNKYYCDKHYDMALHKEHKVTMANNKLVGRTAMGANTVVINDG